MSTPESTRPAPEAALTPPAAKRVPFVRSHHGDDVVDEYAWLADRDEPDTMAYLTAENAYTEQATAHLAALRETLFDEIKRRTQETDLSVPSRKGEWWYYSRTEEGKQYAIHCRLRVDRTATGEPAPPDAVDGAPLPGEDVLLDENLVAGEEAFLSLGTFDVSPDDRLLAYSTDFAGDERFTLRIRNLESGEDLADQVPSTFYGSAWSADATELFYLTVDEAWRPYRVWRHTIGTPHEQDTLVFEEPDERFWVGVGLTRSEAYIVIQASSKTTSEVHVLDATAPTQTPRLVAARRDGVEYSVEHQAAAPGRPERFLVLHNDGAENFTLATAPVDAPAEWTPLIPGDAAVRLADVEAFAGHVVVHLRKDGLTGLRVLTDGQPDRDLAFPEAVYTVEPAGNPDYFTTQFRLHYTSLVTPDSVFDCDLTTGELTLRKRQPVLGDYDPDQYEQYREWATAPDGTRIPISVVSRKGTPRDGSAPCVLYGYGAYEISIDPWFSVARLSLLDRGFVFAIAHVRGGGELGRRWYTEGRLEHKKNTFTDFIAAARAVVEAGWTSSDRLVARGGSAGGLLMGAIANMAPEAFRAIVADVPFVDALTSILDPSLPLTVTEWEEWGDPLHDADAYAYIHSYAPYDNVGVGVAPGAYPSILALAGLNDTRVLYHEPAKWVAKLRAVGASDVLLRTEMGAGHSGPSGRYDAWREAAFATAWIIDVVGAPHES